MICHLLANCPQTWHCLSGVYIQIGGYGHIYFSDKHHKKLLVVIITGERNGGTDWGKGLLLFMPHFSLLFEFFNVIHFLFCGF